MYLLYATEQDAWDRSDQEGMAKGLAYHKTGRGTRYVSSPRETADGQWALPVEGYVLDEVEESTVEMVVTFHEPETDELV